MNNSNDDCFADFILRCVTGKLQKSWPTKFDLLLLFKNSNKQNIDDLREALQLIIEYLKLIVRKLKLNLEPNKIMKLRNTA